MDLVEFTDEDAHALQGECERLKRLVTGLRSAQDDRFGSSILSQMIDVYCRIIRSGHDHTPDPGRSRAQLSIWIFDLVESRLPLPDRRDALVISLSVWFRQWIEGSGDVRILPLLKPRDLRLGARASLYRETWSTLFGQEPEMVRAITAFSERQAGTGAAGLNWATGPSIRRMPWRPRVPVWHPNRASSIPGCPDRRPAPEVRKGRGGGRPEDRPPR